MRISNRRGVTLIELTVALSLAALMVTAVSGVLSGLKRQNEAARFDRLEGVRHGFHAILWNDLSQARAASLVDGTFWLEVPASKLDPGGGPQMVGYRVVGEAGTPGRLVRVEVREDSRTSAPNHGVTVLWGVELATFERVDDYGTPQPLPQSMGPTPRAVRYELRLIGDAAPLAGEVIVR